MSNIASLTVKKADNVTNIVYDALNGSGGDAAPAIWRQDTGAVAGLPTGLRATLQMFAKWNGPRTARQVMFDMVRPYATQDTTTTRFSASDRSVGKTILTLPQGIPQTELNEFVHQYFNALADLTVRTQSGLGFAFS